MGLANFFSWSTPAKCDEIPNIFPLGILESDFVTADVVQIFTKILTDVIERTHGIAEADQPALWDNCLQSESSDGLITRLAKAMACKEELFLVYDKATKVLRKATDAEAEKIRADYKAKAESATGVFISFKKYVRADLVRLYSGLEYSAIAFQHKGMKAAGALQLKFKDLRQSTAIVDSSIVKQQAVDIADALKQGKDVMLDSEDALEMATPDMTASQQAQDRNAKKMSFYLGMPASYITGEAPKGLGDTGKGDAKATERGLKNYFVSIIKPACDAIFKVKCTFKSDDFEQVSTGLEALKTFDLTSEQFLSEENKLKTINKLFNLPEETKGGPPPKEAQPQPTQNIPAGPPAGGKDSPPAGGKA